MYRKLFALILGVMVAAPALAGNSNIKKAIRDRMTPQQLAAYEAALATRPPRTNTSNFTRVPADTCAATTPEIGALPFNAAGTTVGAVDNYDLPADTAAPTCTAPTNCTGAGPAGSLPRGAIYTGTGTGPDFAYQIRVSAACNLTINMDPTGAEDLALIVYEANCSSNLADCVCVDDTGVGGALESVLLNAVAGSIYYVVVDGYSTGGTPPGPSGPFTVQITGTGCTLVPVDLQTFSVE